MKQSRCGYDAYDEQKLAAGCCWRPLLGQQNFNDGVLWSSTVARVVTEVKNFVKLWESR